MAAVAAVTLTAACGGGDSGFSGATTPSTVGGGAATGVQLSLLFGSSGEAETKAVNAAAAAWGKQSGNVVTATPAKDLSQQLTQAMAGGSPPDLFYVDASKFAGLQKSGVLASYGDQIKNKDDFYPVLRQSFSAGGKLYCAPKDFSTLGLQINTDLWTKAGLTAADVPTTWDQLEAVAKKLTSGDVTGLVFNDTLDRVDAFMRQAGGSLQTGDGSAFTANSPENVAGLQYVQKLAKEGVLKFPKQIGVGWGGEALGKGKAAMAIEGNWFVGGVKDDYPNLRYQVAELPAGPKGKATLSFTNCWGIAAKSKNQTAALNFVEYLTGAEQQITFAKGFGAMPSVQSAKATFESDFPAQQAFVKGADYATGPISLPGFDQVQKDFDAKLLGLSDGSTDPKAMLEDLQKNAQAALAAAR
ncbi:extracellular solute-binding protein [Amycolatopsis sp. H20-H5]|uniref:extracellular solute-binding protein n=1 Tax=Amycolatopsis sp. H20-H5 TaxID=3046309 RepID=UPI002DBA3175|nr:extracellular solute-binding protein [Amycolatopsis sp. H20-H5]MEC3979198.1 extracellular solute-binding protein [Amycolatopsis sp. H20-H5]